MNILYYCSKCGKAVYEKYGSGKFCSRKCANSRTFSKETNEKRSKSNKAYFEKNPEARKRSSIAMQKVNALRYSKALEMHAIREKRYCQECNKPIAFGNKTGFCKQHIGLSETYRKKLSDKMKENLQNGKCKSWQSRNISSYAEKFFEKVLTENNISFQREVPVKNNHSSNYFLDFLIIKNNKKIDLEIDGKQHLDDIRKNSDKERDEFLSSNGYNIYRIPWNEINTEKGKNDMKLKIENFIKFLSKI